MDFTAAALALEKALAINPDCIPVLCTLGHLLQEQGDLISANKYLQRALALKYDALIHILIDTAVEPVVESASDLKRKPNTFGRKHTSTG